MAVALCRNGCIHTSANLVCYTRRVADLLEQFLLAFRESFEEYKREISRTEMLIATLGKPPMGEDIKRLLAQQAEERTAFHNYQQARETYVQTALSLMAGQVQG